VEPFAGSAALFFAVKPSAALLADLNEDLITTYKALKRDPLRVLECFARLPRGRAAYYRIRNSLNRDSSDAEIAAHFLYLNRYCFNGLYRTNLQGCFNVPYGPPKRPLIGFTSHVLEAARRLRTATLKSQDFEATLREAGPGDFVYIDPPYAVDDRRVFREYVAGSFTRADLERLSSSLRALDASGAVFLVSYAASREGRSLARDWFSKVIVTRRHVAGFAGDRRRAREYLITNRPLEQATR
jgi:DNA adenine methylase